MPSIAAVVNPVASAAREGLLAPLKWLPPWLFYDEAGSQLFEKITALPEYYLTRTERGLFAAHAGEMVESLGGPVTIAELGAGSAAKTGLLLRAATERQDSVLYQPIDVSPSALDMAADHLQQQLPGVEVRTQVANYITEPYLLNRPKDTRLLAIYIGSSIGNFAPEEAVAILRKLRQQFGPGDALLLGTDLAPSEHKPVSRLLAAYDDAAGVTAAFNRNVLRHLNQALHADFRPEQFAHEVRWNEDESRIEMHLRSLVKQQVHLPGDSTFADVTLHFAQGETIHTENSYKFTRERLDALLVSSGYRLRTAWTDPEKLFAVTLSFAA